MANIITEFKYTKIPLDYTVFNQPLYVLAQVLQYNLQKSEKNKRDSNLDDILDNKTKLKYSFLDKFSVKDDNNDDNDDNEINVKNSKDIYLEIDTYTKNDMDSEFIPDTITNTRLNYLLNRLKYNEKNEFQFSYDGIEMTFKTDIVCDKQAITINREEFSIYST